MNTEERDFLKDFFRQLVDAPLDPASDRRYVPLYTGGMTSIGKDPVEALAMAIESLPGESARLLSGFRGTGKSTELRRLRNRLSRAGYLVVLVDMKDYINMSVPIDVSDFLVAVAGAAGEALANPDLLGTDKTHEGYWTRFAAFVKRTKINLADVTPGVIKANLKHDPTFLQQLQERMAGHIGALVASVQEFFADCLRELRGRHGEEAELVLIVDSIDHIRGTSGNARLVQASVETLFAAHADKLRIPDMHLLYTVPPYLKVLHPKLGTRYTAGAVHIFPAMKIYSQRTRDEHDAGIDALVRVVANRGDVKRLFGRDHLLRKVILASGGHLRDLLWLVSEVILQASTVPVDEAAVEAAVNAVRAEILPIADNDARWLAKIAETHTVALEDKKHLPDLAGFFDTAVVLCYRNGAEWYDIHPLIRDIVIQQARNLEAEHHPPSGNPTRD